MAHLCLKNSQLLRGYAFGDDPRFRAILEDSTRQPWVLYPGSRATVVTDETRDSLRDSFRQKPATVFVVDGTWAQAKKMFRVTPELQRLPWIAFETERRSEYRFRLQPDPLCLATIEAIHELIDALDRHGICQPLPTGAHHNLVDVFRSMNETQLRCANESTVRGYRPGPARSMDQIPPAKRWKKRSLLYRPQEDTDNTER